MRCNFWWPLKGSIVNYFTVQNIYSLPITSCEELSFSTHLMLVLILDLLWSQLVRRYFLTPDLGLGYVICCGWWCFKCCLCFCYCHENFSREEPGSRFFLTSLTGLCWEPGRGTQQLDNLLDTVPLDFSKGNPRVRRLFPVLDPSTDPSEKKISTTEKPV